MKKSMFVVGVVAAAFSLVAMTSCELKMGDDENRVGVYCYVALGAENTLNVTEVKSNTDVLDVANDSFKPTTWNAISEFISVLMKVGDTVTYTFTQPTPGTAAWNSWSLAFWDGAEYTLSKGTFVRGDTWLNPSVGTNSAGFSGVLWSAGDTSASFKYEEGYDAENTSWKLKSDDVVVLSITYDGTNVVITQTINGEKSFTVSSTSWSKK